MRIIQVLIKILKKINQNLIILTIKKIRKQNLKLLKMEEKKSNLIFEQFNIILYCTIIRHDFFFIYMYNICFKKVLFNAKIYIIIIKNQKIIQIDFKLL